jgi:hypothetical protein
MRERERHALAMTAAEATYQLWELESQREEPNLDRMMRRLKDLSAYSLTYAEILEGREGVELLALAMFFGATSNTGFHKNQARLSRLSEEAIAYQGRAEVIKKEVAGRKARKSGKPEDDGDGLPQMRLL